MPKHFFNFLVSFATVLVVLSACKDAAKTEKEEPVDNGTPVTVTTISKEPMADYVVLNANSTFLQKWLVRANINGYLQSADVQLNKYVKKGEILFTIKTKEAQSLGNTISILDSTLHFSGVNKIPATETGFISQINHQTGDYVQDGEQLAVITDTRSFVFLLDMPYELRPYVINKKTLELALPDGEKLTGTISGVMPTMDATAQTQSIILRVNPPHPIPENLIAKVRVVKSLKENTVSLPKAAVLTNETQDEFWIMKMTDNTTAVKIPVHKGIETSDRVEILSPQFSPNDQILVTGNYGLQDTAKVKIVQ